MAVDLSDIMAVPPNDSSVMEKFLSDKCYPYTSLSELVQFSELTVTKRLTSKNAVFTVPLTKSTSFCCSYNKNSTQRFLRSSVPKTMVCHDYKGGYLSDQYVHGGDNPNDYIFTEWFGIDIFVYFSHHLVTVPPVSWINAGHIHGVPVLGTLITEDKAGSEVWNRVLSSWGSIVWFAETLCAISKMHNFDGYLLNVENAIEVNQVPQLIEFVKYLRKLLPSTSYLIWYDSVTNDGALRWQNALNKKNQAFFDVCDGIYLNYNWNNMDLMTGILNAGSRKYDVFVGIDVFGRGSPGAGFLSNVAMEQARRFDLSVAIFAPGWTNESAVGDIDLNDRIFWSSMRKYLYYHGITDKYLKTNFCKGRSDYRPESIRKKWWDLRRQDLQVILPSVLSSDKEMESLVKVTNDLKNSDKEKYTTMERFYQSLPKSSVSIIYDNRLFQVNYLKIDFLPKDGPIDLPLLILESSVEREVTVDVATECAITNKLFDVFCLIEDERFRLVKHDASLVKSITEETCAYTFKIFTTGKIIEIGLKLKEEIHCNLSSFIVNIT